MKLLILDAGHCLSLALAREANRRSDTELVIVEGLELEPGMLEEVAPQALVIPPLARPISAAPAEVTEHARAVESCMEACQAAGVPLVWCVSDQLYEDGFAEPIDEHVIPRPRDESLRRLIATGDRIRAEHPHHLIVRLGPLFALEGSNAWLNELLDTLVTGGELRGEADVTCCPTSADAVAMAMLGMLQQQHCGADAWGSYHLAGTEPVSVYTFVSMVRTQLATRLEGRGEKVELGGVKALRHHHDQPLRRVLNCRRVLDVFGVHQKPWRLELGLMLDAWCQANQPDEEVAKQR
ncbi:sugar nucleotide-binding protein [Halomonas urumqiensis]|uniref:dTDP-4-dehydrorhamnose reductase n=1 Tax=Halomonas urumqiensis TaxID=1684789 RepID=A0A2N7UI36_9GAMM|nr:sugar nucleotide-binding protein [Halomonas urumqiensis]PMR80093.1 dTDP-4-dehydrorhamnose reductase [Halomonas urumqiensis]PTB01272.1 dTDP-4-dehydrorhamnose reductase [Halomonas urumqiensis]GHE22643.1 dTDP-4-dehydrorhamnose reductase [Halomonas urumqiensis]